MFCVGVRVRALHACVNMQAQILRTRDGHAQLETPGCLHGARSPAQRACLLGLMIEWP